MSLTITPHWENPVWYETDVQLALRDLTCKGDVLFDVGANIGGLSSPASRFVGPSGKVVAFEASPRTIATLNNNLALTNCNNVYVEFAAVCDQDDTWLPFYYGHIPKRIVCPIVLVVEMLFLLKQLHLIDIVKIIIWNQILSRWILRGLNYLH